MALLGETALRQEIGNLEIAIEQLHHLVKMSERPNVDLRVIPFTTGWSPALEGPFIVIESADITPVVHLENRRSGLFLHEPQDVDLYRAATSAILEVALSPQDSIGFIAEVIREMEATP
jgi:hypothetical protein